MNNFHKFGVVSTDETHKTLTVKEYTSVDSYNKDMHLMHSQFDFYKDAKKECKRLARMSGTKSLV